MGCSSPTQRLPWKPGRRTGRAFYQRVKNPRVASNSHLNDHGIASSSKKRAQTNRGHCCVKEILAAGRAHWAHAPTAWSCRRGRSAEGGVHDSHFRLTNSVAGGLGLSARDQAHDYSKYEQHYDTDSDVERTDFVHEPLFFRRWARDGRRGRRRRVLRRQH